MPESRMRRQKFPGGRRGTTGASVTWVWLGLVGCSLGPLAIGEGSGGEVPRSSNRSSND